MRRGNALDNIDADKRIDAERLGGTFGLAVAKAKLACWNSVMRSYSPAMARYHSPFAAFCPLGQHVRRPPAQRCVGVTSARDGRTRLSSSRSHRRPDRGRSGSHRHCRHGSFCMPYAQGMSAWDGKEEDVCMIHDVRHILERRIGLPGRAYPTDVRRGTYGDA